MTCLSQFAWEGFSFGHPEDWSPVVLTGNRESGYVRLQGPGRIGCHVRWQKVRRSPDLEKVLSDYAARLERDSKKAKQEHSFSSEPGDGRIAFHHRGSIHGRGQALVSPCGRSFLIEVIGGRSDSLLPMYRLVTEGLKFSAEGEMEPWALFGFCAKLPGGLSPSAKLIQAGRTWLTFRPRRAVVEVGRFAFGEELVARHGLEQWSRAALRIARGDANLDGDRIELSRSGSAFQTNHRALVRLDRDRNQLVAIRTSSKLPKWIPEWHWLD